MDYSRPRLTLEIAVRRTKIRKASAGASEQELHGTSTRTRFPERADRSAYLAERKQLIRRRQILNGFGFLRALQGVPAEIKLEKTS